MFQLSKEEMEYVKSQFATSRNTNFFEDDYMNAKTLQLLSQSDQDNNFPDCLHIVSTILRSVLYVKTKG